MKSLGLSRPAVSATAWTPASGTGANSVITTHTDRRNALQGAGFIQISVQVGGYRPATQRQKDYSSTAP